MSDDWTSLQGLLKCNVQSKSSQFARQTVAVGIDPVSYQILLAGKRCQGAHLPTAAGTQVPTPTRRAGRIS
jgi:hypothetical protein